MDDEYVKRLIITKKHYEALLGSRTTPDTRPYYGVARRSSIGFIYDQLHTIEAMLYKMKTKQ